MTKQVLNRGTIANDGTGDTLRTASLKIQQNFDEIYTKLGDGSTLLPLISFDSSGIIFEGTTADDFETRLSVVDPTADRTVWIPDYSGQLVMDSATQTLKNKTLTSPVLTTPQINDTSADHQYIVAVSELAADRTITLPLLSTNDEFTFNTHTATLKNKTLKSPNISRPTIYPEILDSSGNELLVFGKNASAVNYVKVQNAATGSPAIVEAAGEANSSLSLKGTGNGGVQVNSKLVLKTQGLSSNGAVDAVSPVTNISQSSGGAYTLTSGTTSQNGELKYIVATGSGTHVITETASNLNGGTTITLDQGQAITLIWLSNAWYPVNVYGDSSGGIIS